MTPQEAREWFADMIAQATARTMGEFHSPLGEYMQEAELIFQGIRIGLVDGQSLNIEKLRVIVKKNPDLAVRGESVASAEGGAG